MSNKKCNLLQANPLLAAEWHPTKNGDLLPSQVTAGSNKLVWWLGQCGHEWEATINNRKKGRGCPVCANKKILVGFNDLATVHPELASEWHPTKNGDLLPSQVTFGSHKRVWWLGGCGHEWEAPVCRRAFAQTGCPYCHGCRVLQGSNYLITVHPALAAELHPTKNGDLSPSDVTLLSETKVWWLCSNGHEWEATVAHRRGGAGCPHCAGRRSANLPT